MARGRLANRREALAAMAVTLALAPSFGAAAQTAIPRSDERVIEGVGFVRAVAPPAIIQHLLDTRNVGAATRPLMERSRAPEIRGFRDYLDRTVARQRDKLRQLELVNVYVNRHVQQIDDKELYERADLWAPPASTLLVGGDCEDIVILKRWALLRLGFRPEDMYLVGGVTRMAPTPTFHAVLVVIMRPDRGYLLGSLSDQIYRTKDDSRFEPTYALNEFGFWRVENPRPEDKVYWDAITRAIHTPS